MNMSQAENTSTDGLLILPNRHSGQAGAGKADSRRFFALDSLRASMMLLGIYLHAVVGYSREGGWPYKDAHPTAIYDWTLGCIHAFRMPLFYVMAGFFAALLTYRRGLKSFLWNRTQRILIPFVVGWTLMFPIVVLLGTYARVVDQADPWAKAFHVLVSGEFLQHLHPLHLWFLEYLILLYLIQTIAVAVLPKVVPQFLLSAANEVFRWILKCPWKPLILAAPMFLALCLTRGGSLEDPPGFIPVFRILLPYVLAFAFGWLLYQNNDLLDFMQRWARTHVVAAFGIIVLFLFLGSWMDHHRSGARLIVAGAVSVVMWLLICGLTGVFLRYLDRPMPRMRYMADSSYWLYIVHMLMLMAFQILLRSVPWPAALKVWVVLALAIPAMLLSYHYCVRRTFIGEILNGRRYATTRFMHRAARL
jgi:glucans biosynthesis protein C